VEEWRDGRWHKTVPLLSRSLLVAKRPLVEEAARRLGFALPLSRLFDRKSSEIDKWTALSEMEPDRLLALTALVGVLKEG
ncbi:hypothetical protein GUF98_08010, partial [Xanthomonas citri pv. citri]|nr:hypothetical protein [Xanthomonas citri pv. citri]